MEPHPDEPEEIDGAALHATIRRFREHHALRIARTGERLITRHRRVLQALPMLYHRNHPALPGYVGPDVPQGIAGFRPGRTETVALRAVARGYVEPRLTAHREQLDAIYLMGSGGTIGQTRGSDIDLWVCCDKLMHAALWPKVRLIDRWAAELGLELHTFLVDPEELRSRRRLPGSRMPMLVLDEFYRTGALMSGRFPLWWLIAEDDPARYALAAERLLSNRFVDPSAVVDFGPVGAPSPAELAEAAMTELDRALATPHKSLLKLMLMESYARSPALGVVSSEYRRRIHAGETDPVALDPYLLLYEHVARDLAQRGRHDEVRFARTLLIGKAAESLSKRPTRNVSGPTSSLLARFAAWGFDHDAVAHFSDPESWSIRERWSEHRRIVRALSHGMALVESLVGEAAGDGTGAAERVRRLDGPSERRLRPLRAAVARLTTRHPGCIAELHPALVGRRRPIPLELGRHAERWVIREGRHVVKACRRLVEAALWADLNGAHLTPARSGGPPSRRLAQVLHAIRDARGRVCALVNAESGDQRVPPWQPHGAAGEPSDPTLLSQRNDPLDYGGFHQLHLDTLDLIERDEEGRWRVDSLTGEAGVLTGLGRLLARPAAEVAWQVVGGRERFRLAQRLAELHRFACRVLERPGGLFVMPFGAEIVTVRRHGETVETRRHASLEALARYLDDAGSARLEVDPQSPRLSGVLPAG
ncbi:MAG TPA: class I adenylate cyclase [Pseudomonadales bacterium]